MTSHPGDDFGMMKEVLTRRFKRLLKEDPTVTKACGLICLLIDGGAGQVSAVREIMGIRCWLTSRWSASPKAWIAMRARKNSTAQGNARLRCATMIRCCISSSGCATRRTALPLARIGPNAPKPSAPPRLMTCRASGRARKRALLAHFGSAKAVSRANLADLKAVAGVSEALAQKVYDYFQDG